MIGLFKRPGITGLACAGAAAGVGIVYLLAAGAPMRHLIINGAAFLVGLAANATIVVPRWRLGRAGDFVLPALALVLLGTGWLGTPVEGAARWVNVGPLALQLSLIVLPAMVVAFACSPGMVGAAGMGLAALALAWQPDRGMAAALAVSLVVLALARRSAPVLIACAFSLVAFAATLVQPDLLPAVPYVDQIFYSSFGLHPLLGLAMIAGAGLLCVPGLVRSGGEDAIGPVFAALWASVSVAAALGNYPTPLVGYGGSAIVGYLLSLSLLQVSMRGAVRAREMESAGRSGGGGGPSLAVSLR
jgi:cell division protein FtsW (lipid II flippase)